MYFFFMIEWTAKPTGVYIFSYTAQQERARTHRKKSSPTSQHHTPNNKRLACPRSGAAALAVFRPQLFPVANSIRILFWMLTPPRTSPSASIKTRANPDDVENEVRHLRVSLWRSCSRSCARCCSSSIIHPLWLSTVTTAIVEGCVQHQSQGGCTCMGRAVAFSLCFELATCTTSTYSSDDASTTAG